MIIAFMIAVVVQNMTVDITVTGATPVIFQVFDP